MLVKGGFENRTQVFGNNILGDSVEYSCASNKRVKSSERCGCCVDRPVNISRKFLSLCGKRGVLCTRFVAFFYAAPASSYNHVLLSQPPCHVCTTTNTCVSCPHCINSMGRNTESWHTAACTPRKSTGRKNNQHGLKAHWTSTGGRRKITVTHEKYTKDTHPPKVHTPHLPQAPCLAEKESYPKQTNYDGGGTIVNRTKYG